jgi:hypothetical protein
MNRGINNPGFRALPQSVQSKIISNMKYGGRMYAGGGNLDQLTEFTEGGTHEENPIGGIPQGTAPNGQMNLVEQGETKLNKQNYIFSDQLKIDGNTVAQFNLPKSYIGKTFADASKKLDKPNSRRENDTIEMADTERNLNKLKEAQEFHKQQEVQKKIDEIMALDPNALASMMGQGQQGQQGQPPIDPSMMAQGAPEEMGPEEMAMMEQQAMQQEGAATGDAAMMQQMGMMRNGGMMYANGGYTDEPKFSFQVTNPNNVQDTSDRRYQYPASAINATIYKTPEEAKAGLFKGENDASRTYWNNPDTGEMGEFIGDQDIYNTNFQDWNPEKSRAILRDTRFLAGDEKSPQGYGWTMNNDFETAPDLRKREAREYKINAENAAQELGYRYDLGGFMKDNKQGILGGLQAAAGIGAMFVPGMQGLGTNLIGGGIGNITGEIQGDKQAEMQKKAMDQQQLLANQQANMLPQQGLDPYGNPIVPQGMYSRYGGKMYNVGGYMNGGYVNNLPDENNMIDPSDIASTGGFLETRPNTTFGKGGNMYDNGGGFTKGVPNSYLQTAPLDFKSTIPTLGYHNFFHKKKPGEINNIEELIKDRRNLMPNAIPTGKSMDEMIQSGEGVNKLYNKEQMDVEPVVTNPSQLFSGNYSQSILPSSGVYSNESKKKENYADVGGLSDTTMDLSIDQSPLDFGLQLAPIAWNLAKGLQKPMEFKGKDFYTKIDPTYVDYTNAENTAKETGAGAMKSIKNTVPGGGSYASNVLATQQNINKALAEIDTLEENTNKKLKGDADKLNITRKDAANMEALRMNLATQQAKELLQQEALTQGKGMSEQGTANDLAQKYAVMSAPDISRFKKVGYTPYYQQILESIKNRKTTPKI